MLKFAREAEGARVRETESESESKGESMCADTLTSFNDLFLCPKRKRNALCSMFCLCIRVYLCVCVRVNRQVLRELKLGLYGLLGN